MLIEFPTTFKSQASTSGPITIEVTQNVMATIAKDSLPGYIKVGDPSNAHIMGKSSQQRTT